MRRILAAAVLSIFFLLLALAARSLNQNQHRIADGLGRLAESSDALRTENARLLQRLDAAERRLAEVASARDVAGVRAEITALRFAVSAVEAASRERFARLESRMDAAVAEAAKARKSVPDAAALTAAVLHPSVMISAKGGVGGGTIIYSEREETYVVSAWHVVAKAVRRNARNEEERLPVDVRIYRLDGELDETPAADVVAHDESKDLVLLKLRSTKTYPAAKLAARERLKEVGVFTPIVAVGCPLGHDPMPSIGEISTLHKQVGGEKFWMMNAPTIFGNSGGGVFLRDTNELLGVSAMICTFDNPVTTPVPHLGILVPLDTVYDWLAERRYQFLFDAHARRPAKEGLQAMARVRREW
jgi:S1-C subfamily serine protease